MIPANGLMAVTKEIITSVAIATANTNRDGTGTLGTLVTPSAYGTMVESVRITASATTTAGVIRLFLVDAAAAAKLIDEVLVTPVIPSTVLAVFSTLWTPPAPTGLVFTGQRNTLFVPAGWLLKASTHNAENFNLITKGYDL